MKHLLIFFIALHLISCTSNSIKSENKPAKTDTLLAKKDSSFSNNSSSDDSYNIDYIKSVTTSFTAIVDIDSISVHRLSNIPKRFIDNYITPNPAVTDDNRPLYADFPEAFKFYQFKEFKSFNLFTFVYDDESCCRHLYATSIDKDSLRIRNISLLGYAGGDGGWEGRKYGFWSSDTTLDLVQVSSYDPDLENGPNTQIDTIWETIHLSDSGLFSSLITDSVSYVGDKKK